MTPGFPARDALAHSLKDTLATRLGQEKGRPVARSQATGVMADDDPQAAVAAHGVQFFKSEGEALAPQDAQP